MQLGEGMKIAEARSCKTPNLSIYAQMQTGFAFFALVESIRGG